MSETLSSDVRECRHCGQRIGHPHRPPGVGFVWCHLDLPEAVGSAYCGGLPGLHGAHAEPLAAAYGETT